jgi:hypothetical protein
MIRLRRTVAGILALGLPFSATFGIVAFAGPALAHWKRLHLTGERYALYEIERPRGRYEIYCPRAHGDADAAATVATVEGFVEAACGIETGIGLEPPEDLVRIILFERQEDLEKYAGIEFGKVLDNNGGFYYPPTREIGLVRGDRGPDALAADLRHEATHLLFDLAAASSISPWLGEGLACHFEHARLGGAADRYRSLAAAIVARGEPLGLARLLDARQDVFLGRDNERCYAVAASTATYLLEGAGPELRARFLRHIAAERAGTRRGAAGLARSLGLEVPALEAAVSAWLRTDTALAR